MTTPFQFIRNGKFVDADLQLVLTKTTPANPAKRYVPGYEFEMRRLGQVTKVGCIRLRIGRTRSLTG